MEKARFYCPDCRKYIIPSDKKSFMDFDDWPPRRVPKGKYIYTEYSCKKCKTVLLNTRIKEVTKNGNNKEK